MKIRTSPCHGGAGVCHRGELPNFPIILLSMYWSKLTTRGAMLGGWLGLITAVVLMILGPDYLGTDPRSRKSHLPV
ncbi:hypothetical protein MJK70_01730 [Klebsiella pneumoniae]|nr:hypothetical protein MJK70_01730 [Klebsiella pneumoniae]